MMRRCSGRIHRWLAALDLGADDYPTKPSGMDGLLARVWALLRSPLATPLIGGTVQVGALAVDLDTLQVARDGIALDLTAREFDVLAYLARYAGKVVMHPMLLTEVWGPEYGNEVQYLRVFINRLRRKIEEDPTHPTVIVTEPGVGYLLLPLP